MNFETSETILVIVGGAVAHSAVMTRSIYGEISRVTEKAVEVTAQGATAGVWFPKKALVKVERENGLTSANLAKWFRVNGYQARYFDRYSEVSGVSNA